MEFNITLLLLIILLIVLKKIGLMLTWLKTGYIKYFLKAVKLRGLPPEANPPSAEKPAVSKSGILSGQTPSAPFMARICGRECIKHKRKLRRQLQP